MDELFKPLYIEQPPSPQISMLFSCLVRSFEWTKKINPPEQEQRYATITLKFGGGRGWPITHG